MDTKNVKNNNNKKKKKTKEKKEIGTKKEDKNKKDNINKIFKLLDIKIDESNKESNVTNKKETIDKLKPNYEDLDKYTSEILDYLNTEKENNLIILEDKAKEVNLEKKKISRVSTIEIEEDDNPINISENKHIYNKEYLLEVKDKIFKDPDEIKDNILYNGKLFIKERHQTKKFPDIINYRCKNQRKYENKIGGNFCNALLKRKKEKKYIYYI